MTKIVPSSTPAVANANPAPTARSRRRHGIHPGVTLLAQGEPMLWLTGGALLCCLLMIFGLLSLVVVEGGRTFWAVPVARVTLADGTQVVGELSRTESFRLTSELAARLSGVAAEQAQRLRGDDEDVTTRRRLYRVGNFELTQQHYVWVADYELAADAQPVFDPWLVVLERVEWGRFFGTLEAYQHLRLRPSDGREAELRRIVEFFAAQSGHLSDEEQARLAEPLARLTTALQEDRRARTLEFLRATCGDGWSRQPEAATASESTTEPAPATGWELVLDDETASPLDASAPLDSILGVREIQADPAAAWSAFQQQAAAVRARARKIERINRHDLGRLGDTIERARLAVRRQELLTDSTFVDRAVELANLDEELAAGAAELERLAEVTELVKKHDVSATALARAAETIVDRLREDFAQQSDASRQRATELRQQLAGQPEPLRRSVDDYLEIRARAALRNTETQRELAQLERENAGHRLVLRPANGEPIPLPVASIVRAYPANRLSWLDKCGVYGSRWWEFLTATPREANSEGGVFPAIFGTVTMTLVMSLAVVPFGVLAALYLREYARGGLIVSILRIAINNLAGVPSIVFGVFGLGFFCYLVGAYLDGGPENAGFAPLAPYAWYIGLAVLAAIGTLAFFVGLGSARSSTSSKTWPRWLGRVALSLWVVTTLALVYLLFVTPFFHGLFPERLPNPTLGKGGLLWSSLTLALMTLPVVIVATEEALSSVPNSMREGSYACGAGKWQTIRRIVLPQALPGIMTGMILAMARGAGEVAPLMLVGAVKVAPELPVDTTFPFLHPERSYLHLGFHIFDLGFQSQNSEAAKPMVFTTTLLLIALIASLNLAAVWLRARLRRRFRAVQF